MSEDSCRFEFYAVSPGNSYVCSKGSYCLNQDKTVEKEVVVSLFVKLQKSLFWGGGGAATAHLEPRPIIEVSKSHTRKHTHTYTL